MPKSCTSERTKTRAAMEIRSQADCWPVGYHGLNESSPTVFLSLSAPCKIQLADRESVPCLGSKAHSLVREGQRGLIVSQYSML